MVLREQGSNILDEILFIPAEKLDEMKVNQSEWIAIIRRERSRALEILDQIEQKHIELGVNPKEYGLSLRTRLINWMSIMYHHRNQTRKSGDYYSEHLWSTLSLAIKNGFIEEVLHDALLGHDAIEDIASVREAAMALFFELYQTIKTDPLFDAELTSYHNGQAKDDISSVSKPKMDDKNLRSQKYLELLLKKLLENVKAILIKLFDRLHNMQTIEHQPEEKQISIAKETLDIFVPLAKRLGLYKIQEELLKRCLQILNPKLYADFNQYIAEEIETLTVDHPFLQELKEKLGYNPNSSDPVVAQKVAVLRKTMKDNGLEGVIYSADGILDIRIDPHLLVSRFDILDLTKGVENLTIEDLRLPDLETFANITIIAKTRDDKLAICDKIRRAYPLPKQENPAHGQHRGQTIKLIVEGLGKVFIRVNDLQNEATSDRGKFDEIDNFEVPAEIKSAIEGTFETVEKTGVDIRKALSPELFGQQISLIVVLSPENKTFNIMVPANITAQELYERVTGMSEIPSNIETRIASSLWADRWENTTVLYRKPTKVKRKRATKHTDGTKFENRQYVLFKKV